MVENVERKDALVTDRTEARLLGQAATISTNEIAMSANMMWLLGNTGIMRMHPSQPAAEKFEK
jgi:hypothetical protein